MAATRRTLYHHTSPTMTDSFVKVYPHYSATFLLISEPTYCSTSLASRQ